MEAVDGPSLPSIASHDGADTWSVAFTDKESILFLVFVRCLLPLLLLFVHFWMTMSVMINRPLLPSRMSSMITFPAGRSDRLWSTPCVPGVVVDPDDFDESLGDLLHMESTSLTVNPKSCHWTPARLFRRPSRIPATRSTSEGIELVYTCTCNAWAYTHHFGEHLACSYTVNMFVYVRLRSQQATRHIETQHVYVYGCLSDVRCKPFVVTTRTCIMHLVWLMLMIRCTCQPGAINIHYIHCTASGEWLMKHCTSSQKKADTPKGQ